MNDMQKSSENFLLDSSLGNPLTLIGASAGTGKTYSICAKIVYEIYKDSFELADLALVTFTKNAAQELKARLRQFLQNPEREITGFSLQVNEEKKQKVLSQLDEASIGTLHSFAYEIINLVATQGDVEQGREFKEDDFIKKRALSLSTLRSMRKAEMAFKFNELQLTQQGFQNDKRSKFYTTLDYLMNHLALSHTSTRNSNDYERELTHWGERFSSVYKIFEREAGLISNNTLISTARDLTGNPSVLSLLRNRWKMLVVDEFQDTDPVQWEMIKRGFILPCEGLSAKTRVLLVGDPKQSIYGFRGADITNYKDAEKLATEGENRHYSLRKNYRSDAAVIDAINIVSRALFDGSTERASDDGDHSDGIRYEDITAYQTKRLNTETLCSEKLRDKAHQAGIFVRYVDYSKYDPQNPQNDSMPKELKSRDCIQDSLKDFAAYVQHCLHEGKIVDKHSASGERSLRASDIAVLVKTNSQAEEVGRYLQELKLPYVIMKSSNVFASAMAQSFKLLLLLLKNPYQESLLSVVSLGYLGYKDKIQDLKADDESYEEMLDRWFEFSEYLKRFGFPKFWEKLRLEHALDERLLKRPQGEELLIDALHISELLIAEWSNHKNLDALILWLQNSCEEAQRSSTVPDDSIKRKLSSDKSAVKIMTYHASKGLQFPIVLLPYILFKPGASEPIIQFAFEVKEAEDRHIEYFDTDSLSKNTSKSSEESRGTKLKNELKSEQKRDLRRLDYVALTRAEMLAVLWLPVCAGKSFTKLQRMFEGKTSAYNYESVQQSIQKLMSETDNKHAILLDGITQPLIHDEKNQEEYVPQEQAPPCVLQGDARKFIPVYKVRTSFSGLSQEFQLSREYRQELLELKSSELVQDEGLADENLEFIAQQNGGTGLALDERINPLLYMPAGTEFGTLVHEAFERLIASLQEKNLETGLSEICHCVAGRLCTQSQNIESDDFARALECVFTARLGKDFQDKSLADFDASQCRSELDFDFLLEGRFLDNFIEGLISIWEEELDTNHPLYGYAETLKAVSPEHKLRLQGVMTGSIDLLVREDNKYYVFDYKTNRLSAFGQEAYSHHYQQESMVHAMFEHHYPLQALIYSLALDRIIKTQTASVQPEIAGVGYLFVRGMGYVDEDNVPLGVCSWSFPARMIERAQKLLLVSLV